MSNELISIIVPVYNTGEYLGQCLKSLLEQTYKRIEIIIINDGSTDNSAEIINKYKDVDSRIRVIHQKNMGLSAARNVGINISNGTYVMFVDSDDWIERTTCSKAIEALAVNSYDIVIWSYIREYERNSIKSSVLGECSLQWVNSSEINILRRKLIGLINNELKQPQKVDSLVTAWGKLYKKSVIDKVFFRDTKEIGTEDALFNIEVFENASSICYIPDYLSHYRKSNASSLTHSYKKELVERWERLYTLINDFLVHNQKDEVFFEALSNRISLGLIGIGLNIAEDKKMSCHQKLDEINRILSQPRYECSLRSLKLHFLGFHWKLFFLCAREKKILMFYVLLLLMVSVKSGARG